ncbi:P2Y purinoceptor 11-like isoform X1 [Varanus komodoensis]|uniref:P2Y purinoceptor 11-like isoform X1 n=2 Tax=Varanus komodoensis TaxID=61221 RepID=UPI001CF79B62|nr:P2Y purinoceptor 11-like isoform X1 [Varanus komodoensis]
MTVPMGQEGSPVRNVSESLENIQAAIWFLPIIQSILAIAGNGLAIYRFVVRERPWHTGIIYAFNLAISDLLYAFSLLPLAFYHHPPKDWKFGLVFCLLDRYLFFCNLYGSTFFVACISLNRYVAIVYPFFAHAHIKPRHAKLFSGVVWLLVVGISAPVFHFSSLREKQKGTMECLGSARDEVLFQYFPYSLFLAAFGCGLPFFLTSFSCVAITCTVVRNPNIRPEEKRKVKTLVSMVVVLYAIFYLPFHVLRNMNLNRRMRNHDDKTIYDLYQMAKILVNFHICVHPMFYAALANSMQEYCGRCFQQQRSMQEENVEVKMRLSSDCKVQG